MSDYMSPTHVNVPDLRPHFKHLHWRPMPHSMGHEVASDFADRPVNDPVFGLYKDCGFWTRDEAALLWEWVARAGCSDDTFVDVGAHTGWTTMHICDAAPRGGVVVALEPMLRVKQFEARFLENTADRASAFMTPHDWRSEEFAEHLDLLNSVERTNQWKARGWVIDADHDRPWPMHDAKLAAEHLEDDGFILLHDAWGAPVYEAAEWLLKNGFKGRWYDTPHGVFAAWRGKIPPPEHVPDRRIDWARKRAICGFHYFHRCE